MKDQNKTKAQLIAELEELRQRVSELEQTEPEQVKSKEVLNTEKEFTDTALEAQMDTFFLFDPATSKALHWNRAFREISGYTNEEIARMPAPASYYSSNDMKKAELFIQKVLKERSGTIELELICKNGRKIPTEYRVSVINDDQGEPKYIISIGRDITNRKRAEEELRESEAKFRAVVEGSIQGILVQQKTKPLFVNKVFANILKYETPDEILKMDSVVHLVAPYERERLQAYHEARIKGLSAPDHYEYGALCKDDSIVTLQQAVTVINWANEPAVLSAVLDITERKQAEQKIQLRLNELVTVNAVSQVAASQLEIDSLIELTGERLRQISNVDCLFIALCDYQNNVIKFPYYRYHGVIVDSAPLSMGQGLTSRVVKNRKPLIIDQDYEQRSAEMGVVREIFPGYPDRHPKTWMGIPLQVGDQVVGALGIENFEREYAFNDDDVRLWETIAANFAVAIQNAQLYTTAQQELVERQKLIEELEAKNAELERFTYTVSHDLKSPLITINGFVGYLEEDAISGNMERLKDDTRRIRGAVEKMRRLLDELLELSRIGRLMNPPEEVTFEEIVREALDNVHGQLEERGVAVSLSPNLPAIYGDRQRLIEVLQNLIENATKFMGNQPNPQIEIGQRGEDDGKPVFFVKDNGIGIASEYHELVFGLFNKLEANSEGTGIGLALVKRIVEFHGGRIWVESEGIGEGTTMCFTLSPGGK